MAEVRRLAICLLSLAPPATGGAALGRPTAQTG